MTEDEIARALDAQGWSFLRPVLPDGSLGQQIDSTDIARVLVGEMWHRRWRAKR